MRKSSTFYFAVLLQVILAANLFSADVEPQAEQPAINNSNAENITDEEMGWPQKYRMEYNFIYFSGYKFILNDSKYTFTQISRIFDLTNSITKKLFHEAYNGYKINEDPESYRQVNYIPMAKKAVESYNAFIMSGSPETARLKEIFKRFYIQEKKLKKQERQEEIRQESSVTRFLGINAILGSDAGASLRFGMFFPVSKRFKIGFMADAAFRGHFIFYSTYQPHSPNFFGGVLSVSFKMDWFLVNFGGGIFRRLSDEIITGENYAKLKVDKYEYCLHFSLGWFYDKKVKIFAGFAVRIAMNNVLHKIGYDGSLGSALRHHGFNVEITIGF